MATENDTVESRMKDGGVTVTVTSYIYFPDDDRPLTVPKGARVLCTVCPEETGCLGECGNSDYFPGEYKGIQPCTYCYSGEDCEGECGYSDFLPTLSLSDVGEDIAYVARNFLIPRNLDHAPTEAEESVPQIRSFCQEMNYSSGNGPLTLWFY